MKFYFSYGTKNLERKTQFKITALFQSRLRMKFVRINLNVTVAIPMCLKIRYKDYISQTYLIYFSC